MAKYKNSISDTLSNLVGDQGLRTDVKISLDAVTIAELLLIIPVTVAAGILLANWISKVAKK